MTSEPTGQCLACHATATLGQLLRVVHRIGQAPPFFVCRPSIKPACFQTVGPRDLWSISIAGHPLTVRPAHA